jgi:hypothetical protein
MLSDLTDIRRYELKYTVTESIAARIRDEISSCCVLDCHVPPGETGYTVNNLYFDTPGLKFYYDTRFRKPMRYKARARYYGMKACDWIWPEIKYRQGSIIWKKRYRLPVGHFPELVQTRAVHMREPEIKPQLNRFEDLLHWYDAHPILHVRYFREPYVTTLEDYGRVTFDRRLCYRAVHGSAELDYNEPDMLYFDDPVTTYSPDSPVLLEIKVEPHVPRWIIALIQKFNLNQRPFSKYCYGIDHALAYFTEGRNPVYAQAALR